MKDWRLWSNIPQVRKGHIFVGRFKYEPNDGFKDALGMFEWCVWLFEVSRFIVGSELFPILPCRQGTVIGCYIRLSKSLHRECTFWTALITTLKSVRLCVILRTVWRICGLTYWSLTFWRMYVSKYWSLTLRTMYCSLDVYLWTEQRLKRCTIHDFIHTHHQIRFRRRTAGSLRTGPEARWPHDADSQERRPLHSAPCRDADPIGRICSRTEIMDVCQLLKHLSHDPNSVIVDFVTALTPTI